MAILLWLRSGSDVDARSLLCLLQFLLVPVDELEAELLIVFKIVSGLQRFLLSGRKRDPRQRAVLVVLASQSDPSEVSSE